MNNKVVSITPGMTLYPDKVRQLLAVPPPIIVQGQWPLSNTPSLALLSSAKTPAGILLTVHDLAQQWRQASQLIFSGFHSPVEQEALAILLREPGRVILCPARSLAQRLPATWREALDAGRLTLLSPFPATVQRATKATAITRNRFIAALADAVLIAYAHPGSSTEALTKEVLGWGKPIYTLDHPANQHWQQMGLPFYTNRIMQP